MSLLTAVDNATSGLRAVQADIQVVSGNISNAGIEGYTKKSLVQNADTNVLDGIGGVRVSGYTRATSDAVNKLLNQAIADDGYYGTQKNYLGQIQDLLGSTESNPALAQKLSDFQSSWRSFATAPEVSARQQDVLYKAQNLTTEVTKIAAGLDKVLTDAKTDISASVDILNASLTRIAELNNEISSAESGQQSSVNLQDVRDTEIRKVAALLKVNVIQRPNNRIAVFTPGGATLVDASPSQFVWTGSTITNNGVDVTSSLKGGKLEALIGVLDTAPSASTLNDAGKASVYKVSQQLDKIVDLLANAANSFAIAYDSAATVAGELGASFFTGTTRYNFAVNSALTTGTSTLKQASANPVSSDLNLETRSISAGNLNTTNVSYTTFANSVISANNQNTNQVSDQAKIYSTQKDNYTKRFKDDTGVNVDEELVRLTTLQNNYSASARVISTVKQLYDIINSLIS